ncbi:transporter substrate-binding domain-containing protein [Legionella fairfieldensis]|uniref:transporter substrate-binding domain-containing protein n=1 Tax=Legionella fairfieldensis TaxID=45064 RepID=UPI000569216C|nr:transporter substrate-binding domain-containing protein [Legionella fairfieldensis]
MKVKLFLLTLFFYLSWGIPISYADIKVGTVFFEPPFVMSIDEGFDIQLMQALCLRIQEKCSFIQMDFHKLFAALNNKTIDLAIGIIAITPQDFSRIFSLPYMVSKGQFLILRSSAFKSVNDLIGKKIGVLKGGVRKGGFIDYLVQNYSKSDLEEYPNVEDMISALSNGSIDAVFMEKATASYWKENGEDKFQFLGNDVMIGSGLAIMALPENANLIQRINQQLQNMEKDGSYLSLYKTYFTD